MVITPYLPHRRVGHGGGTAVRGLVTALARKHTVMVLAFVRPGEAHLLEDVTALGVQAIGLPFCDQNTRGVARLAFYTQRLAAALRTPFSGYPHYVEKYAVTATSRLIGAAVESFAPDAIQIEYLQLALYCRDLRRIRDASRSSSPRLVLNTHELGSIPRARRAHRATSPVSSLRFRLEARAWRRLQFDACRWADRTLCVTPEDHQEYAATGGVNLETVPLGMDLTTIVPDWAPGGLDGRETHLFVGSFAHRPNVLAADFLLQRVWPQILAVRPTANLVLAGRGSIDFLDSRLAAGQVAPTNIEALGFVDDLTPLFRNCRVFIAPLGEGGGIKIKVLEAMAHGVPVVTTPVGAEGIATGTAGALTVAPYDAGFANAVIALLDDPTRCEVQARAGRTLIEEQFSWDAIAERLSAIYRSC